MVTKAKKKVRKAALPRPDRYSKKRSGYVSQSVRLEVADAKLIREAATAKRMSTNYWMMTHLVAMAKKELAAAASTTT